MDLQQALEHILDGNAVLFLGAGFSTEALNLRSQFFKTGPELARFLSNLVGLPDDTGLEDASEEFERQFGPDRLVNELKQEYTAKSVANVHIEIARAPWRRVFTTNRDNVLETAYAANSKRLTPVTLSDEVRKISTVETTETLCIHLNGYIDRISRDTLWSEVKLTDSSYVTASISGSAWATIFRQDLSLARAVFFVGYSIADLDLKRILFEQPQLVEKTFFVLGPHPAELTRRRVSRFGTILPFDAAMFGEAIRQKTSKYSPPRIYTLFWIQSA